MSLLKTAIEALVGKKVVFEESGTGFLIRPVDAFLQSGTVINKVDDSALETDAGTYALSAIAAILKV